MFSCCYPPNLSVFKSTLPTSTNNQAHFLHTRDYEHKPHLDRYDEDMLDEDDYEPIGYGARREAELAMKKRDRGVSSYDKPSGSRGVRTTQPSIPFSRMPVALTQDEEGEHLSLQPHSHLSQTRAPLLSLFQST